MNPEFYDSNFHLLVNYLLGEATAAEAAQVEQWLAAHPDHQKQLEQLRLVWNLSPAPATNTVDEEAAWLRLKSRMHQKRGTPAIVHTLNANKWARIAALFVVVAGAALLALVLSPEKPVQVLAVQTTNKVLVDTLPDGSVVTLNKHSQINYPERFQGETRSITLQGEAFFQVAPNKQKPFIIQVNDVTVRVVGTSFNIRTEGRTTEVVVETGIVQVIHNNKVAQLKPKERILVQQQDSLLVKERVEDQLYTYYRTKEFVCDNTPLWKLVQVLNEAYDSQIVIGRKSLRQLPLTTTFRNESLENILTIISETLDVDVIKKDSQIILQ